MIPNLSISAIRYDIWYQTYLYDSVIKYVRWYWTQMIILKIMTDVTQPIFDCYHKIWQMKSNAYDSVIKYSDDTEPKCGYY